MQSVAPDPGSVPARTMHEEAGVRVIERLARRRFDLDGAVLQPMPPNAEGKRVLDPPLTCSESGGPRTGSEEPR